MLQLLYNIFFKPIEYLIEIVFSIFLSIYQNPGICLLFVSLIINFLVLPLYNKADEIQENERKKKKKMEKWEKHIKKHFSSDEKLMVLSAYYKEEKYNPLFALKSLIPLFLQIPFFVAAYNYLSNVTVLEGQGFLFIKDLSLPDQMFSFYGFSINILPIVMTLINIASSFIYANDHSSKDKIQLYITAFVFLVLLYNCPSGLVVYWTCNNIFSLIKNIYKKYYSANKTLLINLLSCLGIVISSFTIIFGYCSNYALSLINVFLFLVCLVIPFRKKLNIQDDGLILKQIIIFQKNYQNGNLSYYKNSIFRLSIILLAVFCGCFIPSMIIASSPEEFTNSISLLTNNFSIYIGVCFYVVLYYLFSSQKWQVCMSFICFSICIIAIVNHLFFGKHYGLISTQLIYEKEPIVSSFETIINCVIDVLIMMLLLFLFFKYKKLVKSILSISVVAFVAFTLYNGYVVLNNIPMANKDTNDVSDEIICLSKEKNNVIVFMLDRAISSYVPYFFENNGYIRDSFTGFSYYPNTISFGQFTNFGTPPLFGGYEYTPMKINERNEKKLVKEQNEALTLLPRVFSDENYNVTVCDPPYANYSWIPDLSIYDEYENINAYITEGMFNLQELTYANQKISEECQKNNFFYYSIFRASPLVFREKVYNQGSYFNTVNAVQTTSAFYNSYGVLKNLERLSYLSNNDKGSFVMIQNSTTHEPDFFNPNDLSYPLKTDKKDLLNFYQNEKIGDGNGNYLKFNNLGQVSYYQTNLASFLALADWLNYLKDNELYDNTRIIIVSDHGRDIKQFSNLQFSNGLNIEPYNALLMVKDFNSYGELKVNNDFMTVADVPTLATNDVIEKPINPYTNQTITNIDKKKKQYITSSCLWSVLSNNETVFDTSDGYWMTVHDDIFDEKNWTIEGND